MLLVTIVLDDKTLVDWAQGCSVFARYLPCAWPRPQTNMEMRGRNGGVTDEDGVSFVKVGADMR